MPQVLSCPLRAPVRDWRLRCRLLGSLPAPGFPAMKSTLSRMLCALLLGLLLLPAVQAGEGDVKLATQLRRPIALSYDKSGDWLLVANRDSGSISVFTSAGKLRGETTIGKQLSDFVPVTGTDLFL